MKQKIKRAQKAIALASSILKKIEKKEVTEKNYKKLGYIVKPYRK